MNKIVVLWVLVFTFVTAKAHNPNTTSVVFSPINGIWTVHLLISQEGANYALNQYYSQIDLPNQPVDRYKELYMDYIKSHIQLKLDDKKMPLGSGGIKLGNHQTDIRFLLSSFPNKYETVELNLSVFKENENQNTVVRFIDGDKEFRKVLNLKNGFTFSFENTPTGFIGKQDEEKANYYYFIIPVFGILLILYLLKRRTTGGNKV